MSLMEYDNTCQLSESSYLAELIACSMETAVNFETERLCSPNLSGDSFFDDLFMGELLQLETELSSEVSLQGIHGKKSSMQNIGYCMECKHSEGAQLEGETSMFGLLLTGAKAVETSDWPLACNAIASLTHILCHEKNDKNPYDMIFVYFTQGLRYKSRSAFEQSHELVPSQTVTMPTFQMLLELSPYVKFAQFTANQAIFEAIKDGNELHVVDFDIMEGIQWPPLMADLALRKNVSMRMTAIIMDPENAGVVQNTGKRLSEFAESVNLPFKFDQMIVRKEQDFDSIEVGHTLIANCAIDQLHTPTRKLSHIGIFLNGVSRLSPKMVVLVEEELLHFAKIASTSFGEFFSKAFQHYAALSDSILYSFSSVGFRLIERKIMGPKILDSVKKFPSERREKVSWEGAFSLFKFFKPSPLSPYNISQAKLLAGVFGKGYWVQHQSCRLSLCWKGQPITTASVWVPINM
ncbi:hypothetical protein RJ639_000537 [Escallonia herrerae]|uniref:Nodulation signaling pathway 2-like protein n=1 Tax=Escallonia herrerae TaxID=1293975 RepID=A0AA88XJR3_9ASTE|nr:hypothetical protein RJ639_000537 [Escallonia herrerae]